jgi:hypothetical protein
VFPSSEKVQILNKERKNSYAEVAEIYGKNESSVCDMVYHISKLRSRCWYIATNSMLDLVLVLSFLPFTWGSTWHVAILSP